MYQGPNMFREEANQKVSTDYPSYGPLFGVFILVAIAAGIIVGLNTRNLLLAGIILVGVVGLGVVVMMLLGHRQNKLQERYIDEIVHGTPKGE